MRLDYSRPLGKERFPLVFEWDWDTGVVDANRGDHLGFKATLTLELPGPTELEFVVAVDDSALLYGNGKEGINLWCDPFQPVRKRQVRYTLGGGEHILELHFFEWRGRAYMRFDIIGLDKVKLARELPRLREQLTGLEKKSLP